MGMPAARAALGFKLHTGWAAVVVATRPRNYLEILLRKRIELLPPDGRIPRFVYHQAAELPLAEAKRLLKRTDQAVRTEAAAALARLLEELRAKGVAVEVAGVATGSKSPPSDLAAILAAHTLIHTAEGVFFQEAIVGACAAHGLRVTRVRERDLWQTLGDDVLKEVDSLRGLIGPPWGSDQKVATGAALVALGLVHTQKA